MLGFNVSLKTKLRDTVSSFIVPAGCKLFLYYLYNVPDSSPTSDKNSDLPDLEQWTPPSTDTGKTSPGTQTRLGRFCVLDM